jgi:serine/threonine-protein phosphatase 2A regulatory subunit A
MLSLCPIIDKPATNEHILPVFLNLLRDENSEVRLNLFKRLHDLNEVIGIEELQQSIIPSLTELSQDKNWRIKLSVVEQFPILARQLGEPFFTDKLNPICVIWLKDSIFTIREAALNNFKQLTIIYGNQWSAKHAVPKIMIQHQDPNYLQRLTPLFFMTMIADTFPADIVKAHFLPVLKTLSRDRVANVRMNVAKSINAIGVGLKA